MTKDQVVNAALLSVGTTFTGLGVVMVNNNFWYAVVAILVGFAAFGLREILP